MTIERILVTGAAGFVGWHVVRALTDRGFRVRGVDNFDPFYSRRMKESGLHLLAPEDRFEFHELDVRHRDAAGQALDGMDAVIHLAARPGVRQSVRAEDTYRSLNVHGTETLLAACRERGVRRIVFASSSSVYGRGVAPPWRESAVEGPPGSPYAATKRAGEVLMRDFAGSTGARVMALRLFSVYGTRQRPDLALHAFVRALAAGEPVTQLGDGGTTRDYTHVRDVARGVLAALEWVDGRAPAFEIVNLGTGQPVRLDSLIAKAAGALDVSPRVTVRARHPADLQHSWADIGKAQALLGYAPRVDLDDGIAEFVTWYEATYGRESRTTA